MTSLLAALLNSIRFGWWNFLLKSSYPRRQTKGGLLVRVGQITGSNGATSLQPLQVRGLPFS